MKGALPQFELLDVPRVRRQELSIQFGLRHPELVHDVVSTVDLLAKYFIGESLKLNQRAAERLLQKAEPLALAPVLVQFLRDDSAPEAAFNDTLIEVGRGRFVRYREAVRDDKVGAAGQCDGGCSQRVPFDELRTALAGKEGDRLVHSAALSSDVPLAVG